MHSKLLTLLLMFGVPHIAYANNVLNDFLLAAQTDVRELDPSVTGGTDMNVVSALIETAQFRFHAQEDNNPKVGNNEYSYELRVKPKAWGQRALEKDILKLHLNQQNKLYNAMLDLAMQKRYVVLLKYQEQLGTTQYLFKLSELLTQEISLIQRQVMTDKFNAEKLLDAENMQAQSGGLAVLNLARLNEMQVLLGLPVDTAETVLDSRGADWLISFAAMTGRLADMTEISQTAPKIMDQRLKVEMTHAKNELIKTEQQIGVNLLRFTYKDNQNDEMAFQFGINIPLGTQFNKAESQYRLQKAQAQLDHSIVNVQQSLEEIKKEIAWLAGEMRLVNLQIQRVQKHLQNEALKVTPLLLINLRKELIEQYKNSAEIKQKALRQYISYLSLSGQLTEQPLRNWIHTGEPELVSSKGY